MRDLYHEGGSIVKSTPCRLTVPRRCMRSRDAMRGPLARIGSQPAASVLKLRYFDASKEIGIAMKCGFNPCLVH